jgi:hypothetical protein
MWLSVPVLSSQETITTRAPGPVVGIGGNHSASQESRLARPVGGTQVVAVYVVAWVGASRKTDLAASTRTFAWEDPSGGPCTGGGSGRRTWGPFEDRLTGPAMRLYRQRMSTHAPHGCRIYVVESPLGHVITP